MPTASGRVVIEYPAVFGSFQQKHSKRQKEEHANSSRRDKASRNRRRQYGAPTGLHGYREWRREAIRNRHACWDLARRAEWRILSFEEGRESEFTLRLKSMIVNIN